MLMYTFEKGIILILMQIQNDHMSKPVFNSSVNKGISNVLRPIQLVKENWENKHYIHKANRNKEMSVLTNAKLLNIPWGN